jgi:hypothetical protein
LRASTAAGEDVGYIRPESIGHGLEMVIKGLIEVYDGVVEGNGRIDVLSNFRNYFIYFQKKNAISESVARLSVLVNKLLNITLSKKNNYAGVSRGMTEVAEPIVLLDYANEVQSVTIRRIQEMSTLITWSFLVQLGRAPTLNPESTPTTTQNHRPIRCVLYEQLQS